MKKMNGRSRTKNFFGLKEVSTKVASVNRNKRVNQFLFKGKDFAICQGKWAVLKENQQLKKRTGGQGSV